MDRSQFRQDNRALSPVIGAVLMVALTVTLMAMVGAVVLEWDPGDTSSEMEVVHETNVSDGNTNITVGVASGEGNLEFLPDTEGTCEWDETADMEKGDTITLTCDTDTLSSDESISIIDDGSHSEVIDELEIGEVVSDHGDTEPTDPGADPSSGFELELIEQDEEVLEGETAVFTVEVENTGVETDEQTIELEAANTNSGQPEVVSEYKDLELDGGESDKIELSWEPPLPDSEYHTVSIHSVDPSNGINNLSPLDVIPADTEPEFDELTVEVTDVNEHQGGHDPVPSDFEISYELTGTSEAAIEFTIDVDGESETISPTDTQGTVTEELPTEANQQDGPADISVTVDDKIICESTVSRDDGVSSVC